MKLDTYEDLLDYNKESGEELSIPISKSLMVDGSNIYRAFLLVNNKKLEQIPWFGNMRINSDVLESIDRDTIKLLMENGTITLYAVWNDVTRPSWSVRLVDIINK